MTTIQDRNPATGELVAEVPVTTGAEVEAAVARARAAQPAWAALGLEERLRRLSGIPERLAARADELADLVTREMGKPRRQALAEVKGWISHTPAELEEIGRALAPELHETASNTVELVRAPHGVVAAISPWNFPVSMPMQILLPALGAGNTVVFKPSELVPLTGAVLAEVVAADLPPGVLELVQGAGETGAQLVAGDVDMVGFVGSRATGQHIMAAAAGSLKRLVLELGGKDPLVVLEDADLEAAAEVAVRHSLRNTGQVCCSIERVYVREEVAEDFERRVLEKAAAWRCGDGFEDGVDMGPMVSAEQREKVRAQLAAAERAGARVAFRGEAPETGGYFQPAVVLLDVPADAGITHEETFGPVVAVTRFSGDDDEAARLANDTPYGLGANVFTGDEARGLALAARIHAGQVGVNQYLGGAPGLPWVGARQSGFGFLGGVEGHRQFTVPKSIARPRGGGR
jgi:succinate-semialdehyde dehydrogenase/glutarate-semialdehyde dehydrogenase